MEPTPKKSMFKKAMEFWAAEDLDVLELIHLNWKVLEVVKCTTMGFLAEALECLMDYLYFILLHNEEDL